MEICVANNCEKWKFPWTNRTSRVWVDSDKLKGRSLFVSYQWRKPKGEHDKGILKLLILVSWIIPISRVTITILVNPIIVLPVQLYFHWIIHKIILWSPCKTLNRFPTGIALHFYTYSQYIYESRRHSEKYMYVTNSSSHGNFIQGVLETEDTNAQNTVSQLHNEWYK